MLKRFFLNTLSSFLGTWIALVVFGAAATILVIGVATKIGASKSQTQEVSKGSILTISLSGQIEENEIPADLDYLSLIQGNVEKKQTLALLRSAIEAAAQNKNVDAIYLKCGACSAAPATFNALRNSLAEFKKSGKKIIAYGQVFTTGTYYVATIADEVYMNPAGHIGLQGLGGVSLFYKGLFDKLGIEFQVAKVGTYKSAVEPYILPSMSHPARAQLDTLYGSMWGIIKDGISEERSGVTPSLLDSLVSQDFLFLKEGKTALKYDLVDKLYYERSVDSVIAATLNKNKDKLNFIAPSLLVSQEDIFMGSNSKKNIAVIYATGEIMDGGGASTINYEKFVPLITELAENDNVKGMVLRVNSPGGSAFGSEQIGEALDYFQSKGKPLAVSMGDYAASGGYWISAKADRIFANPLTITGSIGIFGLIPNGEKLLNKLGLHAELVATNPEAKFPNLYFALTERQLEGMQKMVEEGYNKFVDRVASGRHMTESRVREIGEGRVWDAKKALEIGLVDSLGNINDAVTWVADKASLGSSYGISYYPKYESSIWDFLPDMMNMKMRAMLSGLTEDNLPEELYYKVIKVLNQHPIQARMPEFDLKLR